MKMPCLCSLFLKFCGIVCVCACCMHGHAYRVDFFFLVSWVGVRLSLLGTSTTNWTIVPAPGDRWWIWSSRWNENCFDCPNAILSTTSPTCPDLGSNPGHRWGKPATNRLSLWHGLSCGFTAECTVICALEVRMNRLPRELIWSLLGSSNRLELLLTVRAHCYVEQNFASLPVAFIMQGISSRLKAGNMDADSEPLALGRSVDKCARIDRRFFWLCCKCQVFNKSQIQISKSNNATYFSTITFTK
jgi:hypothetical protein